VAGSIDGACTGAENLSGVQGVGGTGLEPLPSVWDGRPTQFCVWHNEPCMSWSRGRTFRPFG
jgi:hypothetical protein